MRPTRDWREIDKATARFLHRHGVRTKKVLSEDQTRVVHLVAPWADDVWRRLRRHRHGDYLPGVFRRALRRAVHDSEFRQALHAACDIYMERKFLRDQEFNG
jgi:hypothetical protein